MDTPRYTPWTAEVTREGGGEFCAIEDSRGDLVATVMDPALAPLLVAAPVLEAAVMGLRDMLTMANRGALNPRDSIDALQAVDELLIRTRGE